MSAISKQWTVIRHNARGAGPGMQWFYSRAEADDHARLCAAKQPGTRFVVLEVVANAMHPLPDILVETV